MRPHGPSTRKAWEMDGDGQEMESWDAALGSCWRLGQTRCGVKPSPRRGARIKHVHVRHSKRLAVYFGGEIEEVYLILLEDISLCAVARCRSPPSPSATCTRAHSRSHTHTHTQWLLCWRGKMLHRELHIPERSSVCV